MVSLLSVTFVILTVVWVAARVGSFHLVGPYLAGERLLVDTVVLDLSDQKVDSYVERSIEVRNLSERDIKLLGAACSCSCVSLETFPITVASGSVRSVTLKAHIWQPGEFEQRVKFYTDYPDRREFLVTVRAFGI